MLMALLRGVYGSAPAVLILATLGWAGNTVAGRMGVGEVSPMMIVFLRWGLVLALLLVVKRHAIGEAVAITRRRLVWVFMMGGLGMSGFNALFYIAAHYTSAINLGIIQGTMPAYILLGTVIFFRARVGIIQIAGLGLTLLGVAVVVSKGKLASLMMLAGNSGDLIMLFGCLFYSGYALGLRQRPALDGLTMMLVFAFAAWLATIPLVAVEWMLGKMMLPTGMGWLLIGYIALFPSFLSQLLFMRGVDLIGPAKAGLYTNLVPVFSALLGVFMLAERIQFFHLVSLGLVFIGIYAFEGGKKPHQK